MDALFNFIGSIFGYVLLFFNNVFGNFGVSIIFFTLFTRLLMFPLTIKQQKGMAGMQRLQPKMKELQEKYGNDKARYNEEVTKLLSVTDSPEETERRIAILDERFGDRLSVVRSAARYAEIVNKGISKASGIQKLAEVLGVEISETMAIGDAENDISMLKAVGLSVAMGNAVPAVKELCDHKTGNCEENGWAQAVYEHVLKGR